MVDSRPNVGTSGCRSFQDVRHAGIEVERRDCELLGPDLWWSYGRCRKGVSMDIVVHPGERGRGEEDAPCHQMPAEAEVTARIPTKGPTTPTMRMTFERAAARWRRTGGADVLTGTVPEAWRRLGRIPGIATFGAGAEDRVWRAPHLLQNPGSGSDACAARIAERHGSPHVIRVADGRREYIAETKQDRC